MISPSIDLIPSESRVCVLVINWNGKEHLRYSLPPALNQDYQNFEVVVIDNASTDGSTDEIRSSFPSVKLLRSGKNIGYTGAANLGIRYALQEQFDYFLLITNDIVLDTRCISTAVHVIQKESNAGMIGFAMLGAQAYVPREDFEEQAREWKELVTNTTDYIEGAALLASPDLVVRIGGFDEMLFMYGDENDLEIRLQRAGYKLLRINIPVWHNAGRNVMGEMKLDAAFYAARNTLILWTKHYSIRFLLRGFISIVRIACDPFLKIPENKVMQRRSRPSNVIVNAAVVGVAVCSYLWNLPRIAGRMKQDKLSILNERNFARGLEAKPARAD